MDTIKWRERPENIERIKKLHKLNYLKHREKILKKPKNLQKIKQWRLKNKEHIKRYQRNYIKKLTNTSINYKLSMTLRHRFKNAIFKEFKYTSVINLLGCSISEVRKHIETQFQDGMTWDNHGKWHIDHIKPCCSFDLTDIKQQKQCFHYTNLQPLWAIDNLRKNKYEYDKRKNKCR